MWSALIYNTRAGLSYLERYMNQITLKDSLIVSGSMPSNCPRTDKTGLSPYMYDDDDDDDIK